MNVASRLCQLYTLLLLTLTVGCSEALTTDDYQVVEGEIGVREVASGLAIPWGMAFVSDTRMLVTERRGTLKLVDMTTGEVTAVTGAPTVKDSGQGGLLDVVVSPDYTEDGWLYLTYSKVVDAGAATALARARLGEGELVDFQELFVSNHQSGSYKHFGSRIVFDGKGHLFFSHGDRGDRPSAQDLADHGGSILRLNLDGSIPADNPFVDVENAQPETWSYGHRNPQGLAYDRANDRLWIIEHGPRGGDEINLVERGQNYGWPTISYGKEYALPKMVGESTHKEGLEQPEKYYVPSIAPSSLLLYTGDKYPGWNGSLIAGALAGQHLNVVSVDSAGNTTGERRYLTDLGERIRAIVQDPGGAIFLSTDSGRLLVLE